MAEDKIKTQENKLNDEQLEEVAGGDRVWNPRNPDKGLGCGIKLEVHGNV